MIGNSSAVAGRSPRARLARRRPRGAGSSAAAAHSSSCCTPVAVTPSSNPTSSTVAPTSRRAVLPGHEVAAGSPHDARRAADGQSEAAEAARERAAPAAAAAGAIGMPPDQLPAASTTDVGVIDASDVSTRTDPAGALTLRTCAADRRGSGAAGRLRRAPTSASPHQRSRARESAVRHGCLSASAGSRRLSRVAVERRVRHPASASARPSSRAGAPHRPCGQPAACPSGDTRSRRWASAADARDETVVEVEAAEPQSEQRLGVSFDVRREHAGRRARGALAGPRGSISRTSVAARGELVGDGAADDAGANDRDPHVRILVGGWWLVVGGSRRPSGLQGC